MDFSHYKISIKCNCKVSESTSVVKYALNRSTKELGAREENLGSSPIRGVESRTLQHKREVPNG